MHNIELLAHRFRNAIESGISASDPDIVTDICFSQFPEGCCGDASELLAQFLLDHNIKTYYVCGTYGDESFENMQSHAWLLTEDFMIVDITGDQFRNDSRFFFYKHSVYYGKDDAFHKLFDGEDREIRESSGLSNLEIFAQIRLVELYKSICKYLESPPTSFI